MAGKLDGKVALVTGGSRGIGAAIAERLAADGAAVAITYSSSAEQAERVVQAIRAAGGHAHAIRADASDMAAAERAVRDTAAHFGRLDILVNNAGVHAGGAIADVTDADFERLLTVNVRAVFHTVREAARVLADHGRIILIGSVNSDMMPWPGGSVYALTKGAVASFARGVARDLAPRGITVNNVQPGPVDPDINPAQGPFAESMHNLMALKRHGRPAEVAGLVAYLASPEGAFVTGAGLKVDGGFDA